VLFDVERTPVAGRPGLTVRGELDMAAAPALLAAVKAHLAAGPGALVVDLSRTTFLDSSGARALLQIARESAAADVELHVVAPRSNRPVRLPIDLLDLGSAVPLVESAAEIPTGIAGRDAGT
jgi:anti-sigma B factor antagonist